MTKTTEADAAPSTPAGWYDDPFGRARWRWFDGAQWSAYSSDGAAVLSDPDPSLAAPVDDVPDRRRAVAALATLFALFGLAATVFAWSGDDDPSASPSSESAPEVVASEGDDGTVVPEIELDADGDGDGDAEPEDPGADPSFVDPQYDLESFDEAMRRLKVVYDVETNNGERYVREVISDLPRTVLREDGYTLYRDLDSTISCQPEGEVCTDTGHGGNGEPPFNIYYPGEVATTADREIAGRAAACEQADEFSGLDWELCYDLETGIQLSYHPGDDAMEPNAFSSEASVATYFGPPADDDFDLPYPIEMIEGPP